MKLEQAEVLRSILKHCALACGLKLYSADNPSVLEPGYAAVLMQAQGDKSYGLTLFWMRTPDHIGQILIEDRVYWGIAIILMNNSSKESKILTKQYRTLVGEQLAQVSYRASI